MRCILLTTLIILMPFYLFAQINIFKNKYDKKVEYIPNKYEIPFEANTSNNISTKNIWIVYSDKNNNITYKDPNQSVHCKTINFLDSFFVLKTSGEMLEIIKYNSSILKSKNILKEPEKVENYGWINRSNLLLNSKSILDESNKQALKFLTMLNGTQLFPNLFNNWDGKWIPAYSDPELKNIITGSKIKLNEIVFVYKKNKNKWLVGKNNSFSTSNSKEIILGWVDAGYIQQWSSRLCISPNTLNISDTTHQLLFPAKNHAINFENNLVTSTPIKQEDCKIDTKFWISSPFFDESTTIKNNINYTLIHTGTVIKPFNNNNAYIYNAEGTKINHSTLCTLEENAKKTNIIFALNFNNDTKEFYTNIIQSLQDLDIFLDSKNKPNYSFGIINCNNSSTNEVIIKNKYSEVLSSLISITKESIQLKKQLTNSNILNGLIQASLFFKNHSGENNILIVISSQGDENANDQTYKARSEKIISDLVMTNTKLILYQPYSSSGASYSTFVTQAKLILKKYGEKSTPIKRNYQMHLTEEAYTNGFKPLETGNANIYCLDFPEKSITQGFILFPTIGTKLESRYLKIALDSLVNQINQDNQITINEIQSTFNSSSVFNSTSNKYFERYYNMYTTLPRNLEIASKNINFNYFIDGYTIYPKNNHSGIKYYTQQLLITNHEYEEICVVFKKINLNTLLKNPSSDNKNSTEKSIQKIFKEYLNISTKHYKNPTLADFFYETCGYNTSNNLLKKIYLNNIFDNKEISSSNLFDTLEKLNIIFRNFYTIESDQRYLFISNGEKYYWIDENILP